VPDAAIQVESLSKSFPPARSGWRTFFQPFEKPTSIALDSVSFEVREGEALALLGANGAGKSTLLRVLATLLVPTRGTARVAGHDTVQQSRDVRRRLGYHAGTDHGFYARLTARENLLFSDSSTGYLIRTRPSASSGSRNSFNSARLSIARCARFLPARCSV